MYVLKILFEIFNGHLWNFTQNCWTMHRKICILLSYIFCVWVMVSLNCDVITLSETGPCMQQSVTNDHHSTAWALTPMDVDRVYATSMHHGIYSNDKIFCKVWVHVCIHTVHKIIEVYEQIVVYYTIIIPYLSPDDRPSMSFFRNLGCQCVKLLCVVV